LLLSLQFPLPVLLLTDLHYIQAGLVLFHPHRRQVILSSLFI
jgi:hypothetical protein